MSKQSRRPGRRDRASRGLPIEMAEVVQVALTMTDDETEITEARHLSHDNLIAQLGARRRGGVRWRIVYPPDVLAVIDDLEHGPGSLGHESRDSGRFVAGDEAHVQYEGMREWVAENPGAVLVIAHAPAEDRRLKPGT